MIKQTSLHDLRILIVFLSLILNPVSELWAQGDVRVHHYTLEDGLPTNRISSMMQDRNGMIWMATWDGLVKFDGYTFTTYRSRANDKNLLTSYRFLSVESTRGGNILCEVFGQGYWLFDTRGERFHSIDGTVREEVIRVFACGDGYIYFQGESMSLYRISEDSLVKENEQLPEVIPAIPEGAEIYLVKCDSEGHLFILTSRGTLRDGKPMGGDVAYSALCEHDGVVVLASRNGDIACYDLHMETLTLSTLNQCNQSVRELVPFRGDTIVARLSNGIVLFNMRSGKNWLVALPEPRMYNRVFVDNEEGVIWMFGHRKGFYRWTPESGLKQVAYNKETLTPLTRIRPIVLKDRYGNTWAQPADGALSSYDPIINELTPAYSFQNNRREEVNLRFAYAFEDRRHDLWLCDRDDGIKRVSFHSRGFNYITKSRQQEVHSVLEDSQGRIWVGQKRTFEEERVDLSVYDLNGELIGYVQKDGSMSKEEFSPRCFGEDSYCLMEDKSHNIWVGTKFSGIFILSPKSNGNFEMLHYDVDTSRVDALQSEQIYDIRQDSNGKIWIATFGGGLHVVPEYADIHDLSFYNYKNVLLQYPLRRFSKIRTIVELQNGWMLLGCQNGLLACRRDDDDFERLKFLVPIADASSYALNNDDIHNITQLRDGRILVSTSGGGVYTLEDQSTFELPSHFAHLKTSAPDFETVVFSTLEDQDGSIWMVSENRLAKMDSTLNLIGAMPIPNRWSEGRPAVGTSGQLYFPAHGALLWLDGENLFSTTSSVELFLTSLTIHQSDTTLHRTLMGGEAIVLEPNQRDFTIGYATTDYENASLIRYGYRVIGYHDDWLEVGHQPAVSLLNMPAGNYTLEIACTNAEGQVGASYLNVPLILKPKFNETGLAKLLQGLILVALLVTAVFFIRRILQLRRQISLEKQMTLLKLQFFTNVSHELRTPLTLIAGPIEETLNREKLSPEGKRNMQAAHANAERMLRLVNQILDFGKIRADRMKVYLEHVEIQSLLQQTYEQFLSVAKERNIECHFENRIGGLRMVTDLDKLEKIVYNLLSNAFKFTPDNKQIWLTARKEEGDLIVSVKDEGRGIDLDVQGNSIFNRFEMLNDADPSASTGIGLSLVREFALLLHGNITVQSEVGKGSIFTLRLPIDDPSLISSDENVVLKESEAAKSESPTSDQLPQETDSEAREIIRVLIIEDNPEMRTFVCDLLHDVYEVHQASDGEEGLELTRTLMPDLVISDVMMPKMDGIEYLKAVRKDKDLCHIPILLLSARTAISDQVSGLKWGANDYIPKPFSATLLRAKVDGVLARREILLKHISELEASTRPLFRQETKLQPAEAVEDKENLEPVAQLTPYDQKFLQDLLQFIQDDIDNAELRVDDLIEKLNIGRTIFNKKVRALTGSSCMDLVKRMRIQHAVKLLDENKHSITHVAYLSGFSSPQYFAKVFHDIQGCSPKDYKAKVQKKD